MPDMTPELAAALGFCGGFIFALVVFVILFVLMGNEHEQKFSRAVPHPAANPRPTPPLNRNVPPPPCAPPRKGPKA